MSDDLVTCPKCGSDDLSFLQKKDEWHCQACQHRFSTSEEQDAFPSVAPESLRLFLSYGHDDNEELVRRIKADLKRRGHDVWFDREQIEHGDDWRRRITDGIEQSHRVLSFLSKHSTRDPGVCLDEIGIAVGVKGGNIQTILVESETEVKPPPTIGHLQWLDMHDWHERIERSAVDWGPWYQQKLREIVRVVESEESRRFAGEIEQLKNLLDPITSASRISALLKKGFVGRAWLHEAVERWRTQESTSRLLWIVGEPGVGKSAFAAHLTHFGRDRVAAAQFVEWDQPNHRNPHRVIRNLAFQLATRLPDYRKLLLRLPEIGKLDGKTPEELFTYLLAEPLSHGIDGGRHRLIVVIDALDEATDTGNRRNPLVEMLARHAQRLPQWLGFVVTSRPESEVKAALQGLHPVELDTRIEANREDVRNYLRNQLAVSLAARNNADALVARILEASEGVFQYVEHFSEAVRLGHLSLDRPDEFPQGLGGIYLQWFLRQFPNLEDFRKRVRPVLRAVLAAREPLPLSLARQLFPQPEEDFHDLLRSLGSLFPVTGPPDARVIKPCHKSLSDSLQDETRSIDFYVSPTEGHRLFAEAGMREYDRDVSAMSPYMLRHLPTHLCKVGHWDALAGSEDTPGVLTDLRFIQAKCTAGLTNDLVGDYNRALDVIPGGQDDSTPTAVRLRHFANFVSHHLSGLSEYPAETLPIAVNYADSGPVVLQAERLLNEDIVPHLRRTNRPLMIPLRSACLRVIKGHQRPVNSISVTPDGKRIVSGCDKATIRVWEMETGRPIRVLDGHKYDVTSVAITPDGKRIISGSLDESIRVWDLETGKSLQVLKGHSERVESVAVTPDGKRIVSGSKDKTIRVWDIETGKSLKVLEGHSECVESVAISPDGNRIISIDYENIRIWDMETGKSLQVLKSYQYSVAIAPDGKRIVCGSMDKTIRVWDLEKGKQMQVLEDPSSHPNCVVVTPDNKYIVSGSFDGIIRIWDIETGKPLYVLRGHINAVKSVYVTQDHKIVSGGKDGTIRVWDLRIAKFFKAMQGHELGVNSVAVFFNGKRIVSGSQDGTIRVWDAEIGKTLHVLKNSNYEVINVAITSDEKYIISGDWYGTIVIWDLENCKSIEVIERPHREITSKCYMEFGKFLQVMNGYRGWTCCSAVTAERKHICSASSGSKNISVWDWKTDKSLHVLKGHREGVRSILITPDAKYIVSGSYDDTIRIWDIETGQCLRVLEDHKRGVNTVAVTTDGKRIISGSDDKTIRIWDLNTGELLHIHFSNATVNSLAIFPLGDRIVAGMSDGQIHILTPMNFTLCETPMLTEL